MSRYLIRNHKHPKVVLEFNHSGGGIWFENEGPDEWIIYALTAILSYEADPLLYTFYSDGHAIYIEHIFDDYDEEEYIDISEDELEICLNRLCNLFNTYYCKLTP